MKGYRYPLSHSIAHTYQIFWQFSDIKTISKNKPQPIELMQWVKETNADCEIIFDSIGYDNNTGSVLLTFNNEEDEVFFVMTFVE